MFFIKVALMLFTTFLYSFSVTLAMIFMGKRVFSIFAYSWSKMLLLVAGVKVNITGAENIPLEKNIVIISNHSSLVDIPILLSIFKKDVRIIYKKELEKIPIFGQCLKISPFIGVERTDPRKSMESINLAVAELNNGATIIIFPEGTRSIDGVLGEFKRGAFVVAFKAGKDLLPVTLRNTNEILPVGKFKFNAGTIDVIISKPISLPRELNKLEQSLLIEQLKTEIQNNLD